MDIQSQNDKIYCINASSTHPNGTYILRIRLDKPTKLVFGRFKKGKLIDLKQGEYLYIGSALATRGSTTLGNRLRRHTSKSNSRKHQIQDSLLEFFDTLGITYTKNPSPKTLFWNVDHILDLEYCEIIGVIFIRHPVALENTWSEYLEQLEETSVFEKGLGANDSANHTHLQYSKVSTKQWQEFAAKLPNKPNKPL